MMTNDAVAAEPPFVTVGLIRQVIAQERPFNTHAPEHDPPSFRR
jgi:hypothetical protein